MRELLVIGNYGHDEIITQRGERFTALGGATAYMAPVLDAFGSDYALVAKVGADFQYGAQVARAPIVEGAHTTAFLDDFTSGRRVGTVRAQCAPIRAVDLREAAKIGIANGCAGEVLPEAVAQLKALCPVVVADLQSVVRVLDAASVIQLVKLSASGHPVAAIDYLKGSEEEAAFVDADGPVLIVTKGKDGCDLISRGRVTHVPGFPADEVDASGAGDCFLAGFAHGLARGLPAVKAARLANYCGAQAVKVTGIPAFTPDELARVMKDL